MKRKYLIFIGIYLLVSMVVGALVYTDTLSLKRLNWFKSTTAYDTVDKRNDKVIAMINEAIDLEIDNHTQSSMTPGYIQESRANTIAYLQSIKSIESYARYGAMSTRPKNYIELKITLNDGTVYDEVYTGFSCSGYVGACLLLKVDMENGRAVRVYTNGQELKGSPEWIKNDLRLIINKAISNDIDIHYHKYFPEQETQKDFDKQWQDL